MSHAFVSKSIGIFLGLIIAFAQVSPVQAADGSLDPTFGNGGIVITDFEGFEDFGMDLEVQPDGRIIVVGSTSDGLNPNFALARYNPDGSPDMTFGVDGKVGTDIAGGYDSAYAVALQPDGKIIAVGNASNGVDLDFALARYNPDGSLDPTFDLDGKVLSSISPYADYSTDVVLQPDGKILISGWSDGSGIGGMHYLLVRYNNEGSLDTTFGSEGVASIDFGCSAFAYALALQPDGKILVAGDGCTISGRDFVVARYNSDGWLDTTFDGEGIVVTDFGNSHDSAKGVAVQPDGKIILAGSSEPDFASGVDYAMARYNPDGSLDTTFDEDGRVTTDLGGWMDFGNALALQPDGRILVAGEQWQPDGRRSDFALARYNADGSLDAGFGTNGSVITDLGSDRDHGTALALQTDGKLLVAGISNWDFALVRYEAAGAPIHATLDIRPNKFPNRIEIEKNACKDNDNLPVAILTTPEFNALQLVDATSLQIGDPALGGTAAPIHSQGRDIDRDGDKDIWLLFTVCDLVSNNALNESSTELVLTGSTLDGGTFTARDSVEIIGYKPPSSIVPVFDYPVDGQVLDYEGSYLFRVQPIPSAEGYLWGFFQNGIMVWENYRDEGVLSGNEYGIHPGTVAHSKFVRGPVEVWVRASINGQWTDAAVITIHLVPRGDPLEVSIDIKPGSQTNDINPASRGRINVAVLSTPEFDAYVMIDGTSLTFGRTGDENSLLECKAKNRDVNHDGLRDLICTFSIQAAGFQKGDLVGILRGQTLNGTPITGSDSVRVGRAPEDD